MARRIDTGISARNPTRRPPDPRFSAHCRRFYSTDACKRFTRLVPHFDAGPCGMKRDTRTFHADRRGMKTARKNFHAGSAGMETRTGSLHAERAGRKVDDSPFNAGTGVIEVRNISSHPHHVGVETDVPALISEGAVSEVLMKRSERNIRGSRSHTALRKGIPLAQNTRCFCFESHAWTITLSYPRFIRVAAREPDERDRVDYARAVPHSGQRSGLSRRSYPHFGHSPLDNLRSRERRRMRRIAHVMGGMAVSTAGNQCGMRNDRTTPLRLPGPLTS